MPPTARPVRPPFAPLGIAAHLVGLMNNRRQILAAMTPVLSPALGLLSQVFSSKITIDAAAVHPGPEYTPEVLDKLGRQITKALGTLREYEDEIDTLERRARKLRLELSRLYYKLLDWFLDNFTQRATRREQLEDVEEELGAASDKVTDLVSKIGTAAGRFRSCLYLYCLTEAGRANDVADQLQEVLRTTDPPLVAPWGVPAWQEWMTGGPDGPAKHIPTLPPLLRVGELEEIVLPLLQSVATGEPLHWLAQSVRPVIRPGFVPFIGQGKALVLLSDPADETAAVGLLQSMVLRVLLTLGPRRARFMLLDPSGLGRAFPMQRFLPTARNTARDVNADLNELLEDIRRINRDVLTTEAGLHELTPPASDREPFEFVFVANFPRGFDRRAVEALFTIAENGPRAGRYVVIHHPTDVPLPRDMTWDQIKNLDVFRVDRLPHEPADVFRPERLPADPEDWKQLIARVVEASKESTSLAWKDTLGLSDQDWWAKSSAARLECPIGIKRGGEPAAIWFGTNDDGFPCSHGMMAGQPGMGKSNLYHVLITGLAVQYSPDELQFYLVDGKFGTEFASYETLPHARVVSLNSPPELTRSVLQELYREMERRNELFQKYKLEGAVIKDLPAYRRMVEKLPPGERKAMEWLPRIVLMIDEYQVLFEDDLTGQASEWLRRLAAQGRSAGVHMFLGKQTFGAPGMLHQKDTFANVQLRLTFKLNPEEVQALTEFGPLGKRLLKECDAPGKFVLNTSGKDDETYLGTAARIDMTTDVKATVDRLRQKAGGDRAPRPVVFRGDVPPDVLDNAALARVRDGRRWWASPREREEFARRDEAHRDGGLGQATWTAADRPVGLWVGRSLSVHGHAMPLLRRGQMENLAVLCSSAGARAGILGGVFLSVAALYRPDEAAVRILHAGADPDDPTVRVTKTFVKRMLTPLKYDVQFETDPQAGEAFVDALSAELDARTAAGSRDRPSVLAVIAEPERVPALRRVGEGLAAKAPRYEKFRKLLTEGPAQGIHLVVVATGLRGLGQVINERQDLPFFGHRVATQMSEDESFTLFRNRKAAQLQGDGARLVYALYANTQSNSFEKFKPYADPCAETAKPPALDDLTRALHARR